MFISAIAAAWMLALALPPSSSVTAAAAMAALDPISAWQPPVEPAMNMCLPITWATPAARIRGITSSSSGRPRWSATPSSAPGTVPALPAVGAATIRPMRAFSSLTAMAYACTRLRSGEPSTSGASASWLAFQPTMPVRLGSRDARPRRIASLISPRRESIVALRRSAATGSSPTSSKRTSSEASPWAPAMSARVMRLTPPRRAGPA